MAQRVRVWFDGEGDFLEVIFSDKPGYMRETDHDAVMERVDEDGNILGKGKGVRTEWHVGSFQCCDGGQGIAAGAQKERRGARSLVSPDGDADFRIHAPSTPDFFLAAGALLGYDSRLETLLGSLMRYD